MVDVITILGGAASVIQLVDAVVKLKSICDTFKDASSDLADLVSDISISAKQLDRSKEHLEKASLLDLDLVSECLKYLEQALLAVNTVSNEMQKTLRRSKTVGSMRFVWKSNQIQKLRQKLERAQRLMDRTERLIDRVEREITIKERSLHLQTICFNNDLLLRALEQGKLFAQSNSMQQLPLPPLKPQLALGPLKKTTWTDVQRISKGTGYKIVLPRWLWSKAFRVRFEQQKSSIGFHICCYNIVSLNSPIFKAVRDGDIDTVKYLFEKGDANPLAITPSGSSLLNAATFSCQTHMCRFLIDQGADVGYIDHRGRSALHCLADAFVHDIDLCHSKDYRTFKQTFTELIEILAELIPREDHGVEELEAGPAKSSVYLSSMRFLLRGDFSNIQSLSHEDRAEMIMQTDSLDLTNELLGPDLAVREVFEYARSHGHPHRKHLEDFLKKSDEERCGWSQFIKELIAADQSLMAEDFQHPMHDLTSIVGASLYHTACLSKGIDLFSDLQRESNKRLQMYLITLQDLGADLDLLGQTEQYMFLQHGWSERYKDSKRSFMYRWRMVGLNTGPCATDWKVWLAPDGREYEWAGGFWDGIENPELYIPGAFIEDDPY